jgi:AraC family transcriptional regulator of adaptative response/methylated-DNA-[protein]-cysteine methyltransferase
MNLALAPESGTVPMPFTTDEERWEAVRRRDPAAEGSFLYSVASTGVYCRPTCAARVPRRQNVAFHLSPEAAERLGFRPCRRCRPREPSERERRAGAVARACRMIEEAEKPIPLAELARSLGLSRFHFHRLFKEALGVTPKAYADAHRMGRAREGLRQTATVTEAIYDAGFNASSRFYEAAPAMLGMTPTAYREGGKGEAIRFAIRPCSLGLLLAAATDKGLCAIRFGDEPAALEADLRAMFRHARLIEADPAFDAWVAAVVAFVEEPCHGLDLPLDIRGTAFQQRVWQALREVPPGSTATYTAIAARIGEPTAVRAVANACGANPVAVAVPCHRIVRRGGALGGYRWGLSRKKALLEREARQ